MSDVPTFKDGEVAVYNPPGSKARAVRIMRTILVPSVDIQHATSSQRSIVPLDQMRAATPEEQVEYWKALAIALSERR